jgi:hypothetical protein
MVEKEVLAEELFELRPTKGDGSNHVFRHVPEINNLGKGRSNTDSAEHALYNQGTMWRPMRV